MAANELRREVLKSFKSLHRARCFVFKNNKSILEAARKEINNGFRKNMAVSNVDSIKELIKLANDVEFELKTTVVELEPTKEGNYRMHIRPEMFERHDRHVPVKHVPE